MAPRDVENEIRLGSKPFVLYVWEPAMGQGWMELNLPSDITFLSLACHCLSREAVEREKEVAGIAHK